MNVNDHFNDFPIDYFNLEVLNFIDNVGLRNIEEANAHLERSEQLITKEEPLELNSYGYIKDSLSEKLNLNVRNTSVINCAVGQGKTTAILEIVKEHILSNANTYIIIAVPLVSLISQYKKDLLNLGFTEEQIYSYENIRNKDQIDYLNPLFRIHLVTVNTLLGNPGDNAPLQSEAKNSYLQKLSKQFGDNNKKVIFIYDEIHEAIRNFSKIGEAHLYYFSKVIAKNILLSATYNVQSIPVIKMLSKLTDNKIQILESKREVINEQSRLFLHFTNSYNTSSHTPISQLVRQLIREDKNIDILCYSKKLCKNLLDPNTEPGNLLTEKFGTLRDCTSNLEDNQNNTDEDISTNRYDNNFCNIGTNFKSGVSINKEDHAFIIILPPKSKGPYFSNNGIFTEGINSVIQSIARQRTIGEIHIILPHPILMDYSSLRNMSEDQRNHFIQAYNEIAIDPNRTRNRNGVTTPLVRYIPFSEHFEIISNKYSELITRLMIPYLRNSNLDIPDLYDYIMENGEMILTLEGFLGKNLSSFVTYSAFTNQFYNARLAGFYYAPALDEEEFREVMRIAYEEYNEDSNNTHKHLSVKYRELRDKIIGSIPLSYDSNTVAKLKTEIYKYVTTQAEISGIFPRKLPLKYLAVEYANFNDNSTPERRNFSEKIKSFIDKVHNSMIASVNNEPAYFKNYEEVKIFENEENELLNLIQEIKEKNPALKLNGANFFRNIKLEDIAPKFYYYIIDSFYETASYRPRDGETQKNYKRIV
ncbi:DEAD/DEAH box helicase family protein [Chryseobacterium oryctis]|uniref:DEAD/DEAH box helicase family protein n=1 Tax=Chryseobacterium oryctis TaxID=2952618 RepID=A0ABT3HMA8_9FLAO|nr:DEAD/DEAH box helicase family protein [Chryseobacterium oryctis]MCW3160825.1 DEAD/DEAH box helicase family protein [Chryseobacterium oryctis]